MEDDETGLVYVFQGRRERRSDMRRYASCIRYYIYIDYMYIHLQFTHEQCIVCRKNVQWGKLLLLQRRTHSNCDFTGSIITVIVGLLLLSYGTESHLTLMYLYQRSRHAEMCNAGSKAFSTRRVGFNLTRS